MTQDEAFLEAICANPDDDAPRLMYADWLEERGQHDRAEFIRVQCELARLRAEADNSTPISIPRCQLLLREPGLQRREEELWYSPARGFIPAWPNDDWKFTIGEPVPDCVWPQGVVRRGFVEAATCCTSFFLAHGPAIVRSAPLREVRLTGQGAYHNATGKWLWCREGIYVAGHSDLPNVLFTRLCGGVDFNTRNSIRFYDTADLAHTDLSRACLLWARSAVPS